MFNTNGLSASDIAAVIGNNNDGFSGNNGWWVLIVLLALCGGFGYGGYGYAGKGAGVTDGYVLASDFANIERKIDGVNNGLCDGFYAMNTGMLNGFNSIQAGQASLGAQFQQCCCDNKAAIADLRYTMAQQAQAIMQNDNANYRQLHDENIQIQMAAKDATIAELRAMLENANRRAEMEAQTVRLEHSINRVPVPAYVVQNPYCCGNYCNA